PYGAQSISAIHILSHTTPAFLSLGTTNLDRGGLDQYDTDLKAWGELLKPGADILLYGCNLAAGDPGREFINRLADLTGADVAASINNTGGLAAGGDWKLEFQTGPIESTAFSP